MWSTSFWPLGGQQADRETQGQLGTFEQVLVMQR